MANDEPVSSATQKSQSGGVASSSPSSSVYQWVRVNPQAGFAPRDGAGAVVFKGRMWLLGGWNPSDKRHFPRICNNEVWSSEDGAAWYLEKPNTFGTEHFDPERDWEGRHYGGYVVFQDRMWIIGGDSNQGHYQHDIWNSADGKTWTHANQGHHVPWGPRAFSLAFAFRNRLWVMGGQSMPRYAPAPEIFYDDIWSSADGIHWEQVIREGRSWPARGFVGGSVVFKDRMWVLGGGTYDTPTTPQRHFYNDVWSSTDGVKWECHCAHAPWAPRQMHEICIFDSKMWVLEGYIGTNRNDVWYSSDGLNWTELPDTPWAPRHAASVFVHKNALWMVAGNNMESDVWKLTRVPDSEHPCGISTEQNGQTVEVPDFRPGSNRKAGQRS